MSETSKLSTGDVIFLAVVHEDDAASPPPSFLHAEGCADYRIGTAEEYGGAQRACE
jgi:hypothetical protein